jgi:Methyltransferase domain
VHSFIRPFVLPLIRRRKWNRICEIGSSQGEATDQFRDIANLEVTVIDPCLDCDLQQKFTGNVSVDMKKGLSLEVLPKIDGPFQCILIDGDHNWYTVFNELRIISERKLLALGGVIFFHDVDWPWARRDMYYQPETVPLAHRHEWEQGAICRGRSKLLGEVGPFAGVKKATTEGGAQNGVLTAVEDFLRANRGRYNFVRVRVGSGLGIMQFRRGIRDDLTFLFVRCKAFVYGGVYWFLQHAGLGFVRQYSQRDRR